jgi:hypothetical protein
MGVFGAFNTACPPSRYWAALRAERNLFVGGMALQVFGWHASRPARSRCSVGLPFFLTGSGLDVTCITMLRSASPGGPATRGEQTPLELRPA